MLEATANPDEVKIDLLNIETYADLISIYKPCDISMILPSTVNVPKSSAHNPPL